MIDIDAITESMISRIETMVQHADADAHEAITPELTLAKLWPMLESMRVIELVVAIEAEYGIILPDELLGLGNEQTTIRDLAKETERLAKEKGHSGNPFV